jgi:hypothetical protein
MRLRRSIVFAYAWLLMPVLCSAAERLGLRAFTFSSHYDSTTRVVLFEIDTLVFDYDAGEVSDSLRVGKEVSIHPSQVIRRSYNYIYQSLDSCQLQIEHGRSTTGYVDTTVPPEAWALRFSAEGKTLVIPHTTASYYGVVTKAGLNYSIISGNIIFPDGEVLFDIQDSKLNIVKESRRSGSVSALWHRDATALDFKDTIDLQIIDLSSAMVSSEASHNFGVVVSSDRLQFQYNSIISCQLYDLTGRLVQQIERDAPAGTSEIDLNASSLVPGCYWYVLRGDGWTKSGKVMKLP